MYGLIRAYGRAMVGSWYQVLPSGASVPDEGAVLLVSNHSGGLVDGGLMWFLTTRPVRFIAKYTLLKMPVLGFLIRKAGTIPVYRKKDGVDTSKNSASFAAIDAELHSGGGVVVFPEGEGGTTPFLRPFKTGTARMVLSALEHGRWEREVSVIPVGITYEERDRYRSTLHANVGAAVTFRDLREVHATDPALAVRRATARIREALEGLVPEHASHDEVPATRLAADLIPARGRALPERMVSVRAGLRRLAEVAPGRAARLTGELTAVARQLTAAGLEVSDLARTTSLFQVLGALIQAAAGLVSRAVALLLWLPAWILARPIAQRFAPRDKVVTFTLIGMSFAGVLWLGAAVWLAWDGGGPFAGLGAAAALLGAWALAGTAREQWDAALRTLRRRLHAPRLQAELGSRLEALRMDLGRRSIAFARLQGMEAAMSASTSA